LKDQYLLDPDVVFLNHGSFGACPRPVFAAYQKWQRKLEQQPVQFLSQDIYTHLEKARTDLGNFIGCDANDLFFVQNPTTAINTVIRSLDFERDCEVLSSNHEYGALVRAWNWFHKEKGYRFVQRDMPLPVFSHQEFADYFCEGITDRTRFIFLSHITSATGLIFPVDEICKRARTNGILSIIDGAHVPGHIPLNIKEMDPDIYTGACHKWLSAPKGSTFLYVKKEIQEKIKPLVVSWGNDVDPSRSTFLYNNQYQGTTDPSAYLAVSEAIKFQTENKWDSIKKRCIELTRTTRDRVLNVLGTPEICPKTDEWLGQMASVLIPHKDVDQIEEDLLSQFHIVIPVFEWQDQNFLRFSFNAYNDDSDADKLVSALKKLIP